MAIKHGLFFWGGKSLLFSKIQGESRGGRGGGGGGEGPTQCS